MLGIQQVLHKCPLLHYYSSSLLLLVYHPLEKEVKSRGEKEELLLV
jgi:hypothetical protein